MDPRLFEEAQEQIKPVVKTISDSYFPIAIS